MGTASIIIQNLVIFIAVTGFFLSFSRQPLRNPDSHGFYRFFGLEGILLICLLNFPYWHQEMLSPAQLLSWTLLAISIFFVSQGFLQLRKLGGTRPAEINPENLDFENTGRIVAEGIYRYIRHPMYSSLLLLTWGAMLKHITVYTTALALITTLFLAVTARKEELENDLFFGTAYGQYMRKTKMFIPYIF